MTTIATPIGIRNNNPGNLRRAYGMLYPTVINNGYAQYRTMTDGVQSLAMLVSDYYVQHGLKTLPDFVSRYAPASENDVAQYVRNMTLILKANPLTVHERDLRLDISWNALEFIRAIIRCENSLPALSLYPSGEWVTVDEVYTGMQRAAKWKVL